MFQSVAAFCFGKYTQKNVRKRMEDYNIIDNFAAHWLAIPLYRWKAIKRESGENPGQSRCCMFQF